MKTLRPCSFTNGITTDVYASKTDGHTVWATPEVRDLVANRLERFAMRGSVEELDEDTLWLSRELANTQADDQGLIKIAFAVAIGA